MLSEFPRGFIGSLCWGLTKTPQTFRRSVKWVTGNMNEKKIVCNSFVFGKKDDRAETFLRGVRHVQSSVLSGENTSLNKTSSHGRRPTDPTIRCHEIPRYLLLKKKKKIKNPQPRLPWDRPIGPGCRTGRESGRWIWPAIRTGLRPRTRTARTSPARRRTRVVATWPAGSRPSAARKPRTPGENGFRCRRRWKKQKKFGR